MKLTTLRKILIDSLTGSDTDPVKHCDVYKSDGCAHVDGFICDIKTCPILEEFKDDRAAL